MLLKYCSGVLVLAKLALQVSAQHIRFGIVIGNIKNKFRKYPLKSDRRSTVARGFSEISPKMTIDITNLLNIQLIQ